jgi:O-antigen ligase
MEGPVTPVRALPERTAATLLGLALAGGAVAGAAEEYSALAMTEAAVFLAGAVALLGVFVPSGPRGGFPTRETKIAGCALGALLLVALLQIVLTPQPGFPGAGLKTHFGSLLPTETEREAWKLAACLVAFFIAARSAGDRRTLALLVLPLGAATALLSLYGLLQLFTDGSLPVLYSHRAWAYGDRLTATYTNPNHFAGLLEMIIPLVLGATVLAVLRQPAHDEATLIHRVRATLLGSPAVAAGMISVIVMGVALIFTQSRMGIFCGAVGALFLAISRRGARARWRGIVIFLVLVVVLVSAGTALGVDPLLERFSLIERDAGGRFDLWGDTWRGLSDRYWLTGSGLGTYLFTFPEYQTGRPGAEYAEAHNDYLQLAWETGVAGTVLGGFFLLVLMRCILRRSTVADPVLRGAGLGAAAGALAILLHSILDFNLQVPANGLVFAVLTGIAIATRSRDSAIPSALPNSLELSCSPYRSDPFS